MPNDYKRLADNLHDDVFGPGCPNCDNNPEGLFTAARRGKYQWVCHRCGEKFAAQWSPKDIDRPEDDTNA